MTKSLVVGVIGHVDHGKTALVKALTGEDTDRLAEEKARGISIALGFARLQLEAGSEIDLIDMPGHERFVRTMIAGATGMDAVLLVLAANEGIKPQTREHVDIAGLLGLKQAVVAISKIDLVTPGQAAQVANDAMHLLAQAGLTALPPVPTSVPRQEGIAALRECFSTLLAGTKTRAAQGTMFLPIDRAFSIPGHGPVVTGTLRGAGVAAGDLLELFPARTKLRVRAVQVHGAKIASATPGQRVALNLRDVEIGGLSRGMALAAPDTILPSEWVSVALRAVASAPKLKNGMRLRALLGTGEFDARLRLLDREMLEPGETAFAQLHFATAIATPSRENIVLRLISPSITVAGGKILEPETKRARRNVQPVLHRLKNLAELPPAPMFAAELETQGFAGSSVRRLARLSALSPARVVEVLQSLPVVVTRLGLVARPAELEILVQRVPALIARQAEGLAREKLLSQLPGVGPEMLDEALARLLARGIIVKSAGQFLVPRPAEDRARAQSETTIGLELESVLRNTGLTPPTPKELITSLAAKRAMDRLLRDGVVIRAVDRAKDKEILFHHTAIEAAKTRLEPLLKRSPGMLATEMGAALGITRKYLMPLLDHLDTIRFTRREGDRRHLAGRVKV